MEILLSIAYIAFFIFLIGKISFFRFDAISLNHIKAGFLIKVAAGIMVGLVYTFYYTDRLTADTFKFFDDSLIIYNSVFDSPLLFFQMITGIGSNSILLQPYYDEMNNWYDVFSPFNDNRTMIRFNALVRFFSFGHYYVHVVFICFLSITGITAIVKVLMTEYPRLAYEFYLILLLLPSVLFWGSGLLKDSLVFFSFGMVLFMFNKTIGVNSFSLRNLVWLLLAFFLLMITKFQVFLLVLPLLTAWFLVKKFKIHPLLAFSGVSLIVLVLVSLPTSKIVGLNLAELLSYKQAAFIELAQSAKAGSAIQIPVLKPEMQSLIANAPHGFITSLTRPFITDGGPALTRISGIENTLILAFCLLCLFNFKKGVFSSNVVPWFCLFYVVTYFTLIGLVTPVLGAIVRYKAQALPFLVIMFVIISSGDNQSIIKKAYSKLARSLWKSSL